MKKNLLLLLVIFVAGCFNASAQALDLSGILTKSESVTVTTENDATYPWALADGWLSSTNKDHSSDAAFTLTFSSEGLTKVSFDYSLSSESYDRFIYTVDGSDKTISGNGTTPKTGTYTGCFSPGTHTIVLRYKKDGSGTSGEDLAKVQNIVITDMLDPAVMKTIHLSAPGTLGTEALNLVDRLPDVLSLKLSGTLNSDDWNVINNMTSLLYIDLSETTVTEIPASAFAVTPIRGIVWPANLEKIGEKAVYSRYLLGSLTFPATLKSIGNSAFYQNLMTDITLPASLTELGTNVFKNNDQLKTVTFKKALTTLPAGTFNDCDSLTTVSGLEGIETVGEEAFYSCENLTSVGAMAPIEVNGDAFTDCRSLAAIDLSQAKTLGFNAFYNCDALVEVELPQLTSGAEKAFYDCNALQRITIGDYLTAIPQFFCYECSNLEEVILGASVSSIGYNAFYDKDANVKNIYLNAPTPPTANLSNKPFYNYAATLYVPSYAMVEYKLHDYWKGFAAFEVNPNEVANVEIKHALNLASTARIPNTPNVIVNLGGALVVNGAAAQPMNHFISKHNTSESGTLSGVVLSRCQNMTSNSSEVHFSLASNSYWYFICPPFDVNMADISTTNNAELAIRYYDGETRAAAEASNWKDMPADGVLKAGTGYIFRASASCKVYLPATEDTRNQIFTAEDLSVALTEYSSSDATDANWNLVGNPYAAYYNINKMNFTAPITRWNTSSNTYTAYSIVDDAIAIRPLEAFFVQKPEGIAAIGFPAEGRQTDAVVETVAATNAKHSAAANRFLVELTLDGGEAADMTRIVVNPAAADEYNIETDAAKMMAFETTPQLYSLRNGVAYAINEGAQQEGSVQLGMWLPAEGNYTINLKRADTEVELLDNGTPVAMPYTFAAENGYDENRFALHFKTLPTAIEQVSIDAEHNTTYDLQGRKIQQPMQRGIYIVNGKSRLWR